MKKLAFWIELNTHMKNLTFYISSFQNSWHFVFYIPLETKHSLMVYLVPHFTKKIWVLVYHFCKMKLNTMQKFWQKGIHSPF
jgi:hypothetical protein